MYNGTNWQNYLRDAQNFVENEAPEEILIKENHPQGIAGDSITVILKQKDIIENLYVYNALGNIFLRMEAVQSFFAELDVRSLKPGVYSIACMLENGKIKTKRFLKE